HYSNAFLHPIVLAPHSEQTIYALVCTGTSQQVNEQIQKFQSTPETLTSLIQKDSNNSEDRIFADGKKYEFGHHLLQSALSVQHCLSRSYPRAIYPAFYARQKLE
ncbi:MAG: hypothetical protein V8R12_21995, partial [Bacteroides faecis]